MKLSERTAVLIGAAFMCAGSTAGLFLLWLYMENKYPDYLKPHTASLIEIVTGLGIILLTFSAGMAVGILLWLLCLRPIFRRQEMLAMMGNVSDFTPGWGWLVKALHGMVKLVYWSPKTAA